MEEDISQLKTFSISTLNQVGQVMSTPRVLQCFKLISSHPPPMPRKSTLTITIRLPRVALLMLANYSYFQSHIIQLPSLATLDPTDHLANYAPLHTMGTRVRG